MRRHSGKDLDDTMIHSGIMENRGITKKAWLDGPGNVHGLGVEAVTQE